MRVRRNGHMEEEREHSGQPTAAATAQEVIIMHWLKKSRGINIDQAKSSQVTLTR